LSALGFWIVPRRRILPHELLERHILESAPHRTKDVRHPSREQTLPIPYAPLPTLKREEFRRLESVDLPRPDVEFGRRLVYPSVELLQRNDG